jgi:pyruvate dehydrogenase E2 component (dihydrolipoamide acetyltransferase)
MNYFVPMPSLGADMDQGKLMQWLIRPGDLVKKNQAIAQVETTKSVVEIESFRQGKVLELLAHEGDQILVGKPIALFDVVGDEVASIPQPVIPSERIKISPAARKLAEEQGLDLKNIKGSGAEGQIELKDVPRPVTSTGVNIREAIGRAMSRSKKEIPHYYLKSQVRLDPLMQWLDEKNKNLEPEQRWMMPVALLRAIILALKDHPEMNGYYQNGSFQPSTVIHLGTAIALKSGGVLVPALMDAEQKTLSTLNQEFQDLIKRTQKGELKNRELTEGTMTVTNVGELGSHEVFGIIFPPQVALVGLGRIHETAIFEGSIVRRGFVIDITLSADHRVSDGLSGSRFLTSIEKILLNPQQLEK